MEAVLDVFFIVLWAIIGFGILVFIHELGHMLVGLATGIGVEEFSIGFGPAIIKFKIKGIEFKLSVVPLGGYCKFKGQDDFGTGQQNKEPDDFYSRPRWARLLTVFAGPLANIILAIIIFTIIFLIPQPMLVNKTIVVNSDIENEIELKSGDEIVAVNGKEIKYGNTLQKITMNNFNENINLTVRRNGELLNVKYEPSYKSMESGIQEITIGDSNNPVVTSVLKDYPADKAGIRVGDEILEINGDDVNLSSEISSIIAESGSDNVSVKIKRNNEIIDMNIGLATEKDGRKIIGIHSVNLTNPKYEEIQRSFGKAFTDSILECYNSVKMTIKGLGMLFTGQADVSKTVAGPIAIFGIVGTVATKHGFLSFLNMIGLISVLLGFFNLLPLPAVDGGHIVITIIEMIRGKNFSMKTMQVIQIIGVVLILSLFVLVAIKDIINLPEMLKGFK